MAIDWVFDPTPPSGARSGGDVAEHAFTPDIEVFVREVLQNAKDQHLGAADPVSVIFRLIRLEGKSAEEFLRNLGWKTLRRHLDAASHSVNGASYELALNRVII